MRRLAFTPKQHGFHFRNLFINHPIAPNFGPTTAGLCGGMALAAARYWQHQVPVPTHVGSDFPDGSPAGVPPEGSLLQGYIYGCQLESFGELGLLSSTQWLVGPFDNRDVQFQWSLNGFPQITQRIDAGMPVVLGLRRVFGGPTGHQVLAYGYDEADLRLFVYDSNCPDEEKTLRLDTARRIIVYDDAYSPDWSSYFITGCRMEGEKPPYVDLGLLAGLTVTSGAQTTAGEPVSVDVVVRNFGFRAAHLSQLCIHVRGPQGENLDALLGGGDSNSQPIPPGGERHIQRAAPSFAAVPGKYAIGVSYLSEQGQLIGIPSVTPGTRNETSVDVVAPVPPILPPIVQGMPSNALALVRQTPGWGSIPIASAKGDGSWNFKNATFPQFPNWAHESGVRVIAGDFNGNGLTDIALVRQTPGWESIPIAFSRGDGSWDVKNSVFPQFPNWAHEPGVQLIPGKFNSNGNGRTDIALVRQTPGWGSIPIAFSRGDGSWDVKNNYFPQFPNWACEPGVRVIAGDFNGNGLTDIALVRQTPGWGSIPIAFSRGDGSWDVKNSVFPQFPNWAHEPGVQLIPGKFNSNGNGRTDIALVRQTPGWGSIPIAFSRGDGSWDVKNNYFPQFPNWACEPGVRVIAGDFNGNGLTDIALVRQTPGWGSIPIAFARGDGTWDVKNHAFPQFPNWACEPGVQVIAGNFNGNSLTDIALVRQTPGWGSIPIAFAKGDGTWDVSNSAFLEFPACAHQPGVQVVSGKFI